MISLINSQNAARLMCIPSPSEPGPQDCDKGSARGALLGNGLRLNVPVFLDLEDLINPHILICGMTGGG